MFIAKDDLWGVIHELPLHKIILLKHLQKNIIKVIEETGDTNG